MSASKELKTLVFERTREAQDIICSLDDRQAQFVDLMASAAEEDIGRLEVILARTKEKSRNYKLQLKQLHRAHVVLKRDYERLKAQHDSGPSGPDFEIEVRYIPVPDLRT